MKKFSSAMIGSSPSVYSLMIENGNVRLRTSILGAKTSYTTPKAADDGTHDSTLTRLFDP